MANNFRINGREISGTEVWQVLENDIFRLLNRAEELLETDFKLGRRLFRRADRLYRWQEPDYDIRNRIEEVFQKYVDKGLLPRA